MRLVLTLAFVAIYLTFSNGGETFSPKENLQTDTSAYANDSKEAYAGGEGDAAVGGGVQAGMKGNAAIGGPLGGFGIKGGLRGSARGVGEHARNGSTVGSTGGTGISGEVEANIGGEAGITCVIEGSADSMGEVDFKVARGSEKLDGKLPAGLTCKFRGRIFKVGGTSGIGGKAATDLRSDLSKLRERRLYLLNTVRNRAGVVGGK